jgi:hypothetical protein
MAHRRRHYAFGHARAATTLALWLVLGNAAALVPGCNKNSPEKKSPGVSAWRVIERIPLANEYEIVISFDADRSFKQLDIRRHGQIEWRSSLYSDEPGDTHIMLPARSGTEPLLTELDQDLTLDGIPNVVVREYTGGAHCCTEDHILSLNSDGLIGYQGIDFGHASYVGQHYVPGERGSQLDIMTDDWTFAYWKMSFAESPAPVVRLRLRGSEQCGRLSWTFANSKQSVSVEQLQELRADARKRNTMPGGPIGTVALPGLLSNTLDLIYDGNAADAQSYLYLAFEGFENARLGFLVELGIRLKVSRHIDLILELNEVDTIGELLAGDEGRFGRWD